MQRTLEYVHSSMRRFERMNMELSALRHENQRLRELVSSLQGVPPEPAPAPCACDGPAVHDALGEGMH